MLKCMRYDNNVLNSCSYLLQNNSNNAVLIDCGDSVPIIQYLKTVGGQLSAVFITHCHYDHIYGLNSLLLEFQETIIYTSETGKLGLFDSKLNLSKYCENPFKFQFDEIFVIDKNQRFCIGDIIIDAFLTPGHDTSCITYQCQDMLFTGDSLIPGVKTLTNLPRSNKLQAEYYENWIRNKIKSEHLTIYPGHHIV